jgi:hypothetical protein
LPAITLQNVEAIRALKPKRFRFSETPCVRERKEEQRHVVGLKFPSLKRLFQKDTGIETYDGPYGPFRFLTDEEKIATALRWQEQHKSLIFLRDNLDFSVAIDLNLAAPGIYTALGQAEHDAKVARKFNAIRQLVAACAGTIGIISLYGEADAICAVPPSPGKDWDLPSELAKYLSAKTGKENLSGAIKFGKDKKSVKAVALDEKWKALDAAGLRVSPDIKGKKVILLDDKYQSGTTAQFVGSRLYSAGASAVYGLFCVKTWRDTDNA